MSNIEIKKIVELKYDLVATSYTGSYYNAIFDPAKLKISEKILDTPCIAAQVGWGSRSKLASSPDKKYEFTGDLNKIKTYYFIPNTKFDRDYFKRLYPNLKYTRIIKNTDLVIYDDNSYKNNFLLKFKGVVTNKHDYSYAHDGVYYAIFDYTTKYMVEYKSNTSYKKIFDKAMYGNNLVLLNNEDQPDLYGKMIHIDKLFEGMKTDLLSDNLDLESALTYLKQIMSKNIGAQKAAVESLLSYSGFNLTKAIMLSFAPNSSTLKSAKFDFFIKKIGTWSTQLPIFGFIQNVSEEIQEKSYSDDRDKKLSLEILNNKVFQDHWMKYIKIPYKLEFLLEAPSEPVKSVETNIAEFIV